jgi:hypothetical protein
MLQDRYRDLTGLTIPRTLLIAAIMVTLVPIAYTIAEPPSRGQDVCNNCHGGRYDLIIEDPVFTLPADIDKGESIQVTVTVDVSGDGTNAYWEFDMTVRLKSVNSKVTLSPAQTFRDQRLSGSSEPFTWTKDVAFTLTGSRGGTDTIRAEAVIDPDHQVGSVTRYSTKSINVNNIVPLLSSGFVTPSSGPYGTGFEFGVTYTDGNGDPPSFIRVHVGDIQYSLSPRDGSADSITTGEVYSTQDLILDEGSYSYHFESSDGDDQVREPVSGELDGPDVLHVNAGPVLEDPEITPYAGFCNEEYTFRVTSKD